MIWGHSMTWLPGLFGDTNEDILDLLRAFYRQHPPPVLTKADFVKRYAAGEFGNRSPTWQTFEEWYDATVREWRSVGSVNSYHLRNRTAGGTTYYALSWPNLYEVWVEQSDKKAWYCSAMCPHEHNLLQGEVMLTTEGVYLNYSTVVGKPMREALAEESKHAYGLRAIFLLKQALNPVSYDWLQVLLDLYPDHTVEFTALSVEWGTLPGYNTLFWEVRRY